MDDAASPIGVFDSGLGGVSVLREAVQLLPNENFIYFGDDANAPYGTRSEDEIRELSLRSGDFLCSQGVKMIVVACNTATSIVIQQMRDRYNVPIISMEPAVKPASEKHAAGTIAVFATPATLRQARYLHLLKRLSLEKRVRGVSCGQLAGLIERSWREGTDQVRAYLAAKMHELADEPDVCALVVGCSHYTFVRSMMQEEAAKALTGACEIFDGAEGTARRIRQILEESGSQNTSGKEGTVRFYSSAGEQAVRAMQQFARPGFELA